jgi:hypothetical protein
MVAEKGGRIILVCHEKLVRLLAGVPHIAQIVSLKQPTPAFDVFCPLLSLPLVLGTTLHNIPANVPYLKSERPRLAKKPDVLRVGLAWSGNPEHWDDLRRSIPIEQFAPLSAVPGIEFYSLQVGPAPKQETDSSAMLRLIDLTSELHDFADTASLIESLDLVITVDTAVAHLAGAMGKPVWILLAAMPHLAMDARSRGFAVVSDDGIVPAKQDRQLGGRYPPCCRFVCGIRSSVGPAISRRARNTSIIVSCGYWFASLLIHPEDVASTVIWQCSRLAPPRNVRAHACGIAEWRDCGDDKPRRREIIEPNGAHHEDTLGDPMRNALTSRFHSLLFSGSPYRNRHFTDRPEIWADPFPDFACISRNCRISSMIQYYLMRHFAVLGELYDSGFYM